MVRIRLHVGVRIFLMSRKEQWLSRIVFYAGAIGLLWIMGKMSPSSAELEAQLDRELGAAQIQITFPSKS